MWVNHLFYLGVLEQLLCTLPYGGVGLSLVSRVAVLNVFVGAEVESLLYCGRPSLASWRSQLPPSSVSKE
jgi:hypothetical protein